MEVKDILIIASFIGLILFIGHLTNTIISADKHYESCQGRHVDLTEESQNITTTLQPAAYPVKQVLKDIALFDKDCIP
jgi:hypothetical protein